VKFGSRGIDMGEARKRLGPDYCLSKEAEYRERSSNSEIAPEERDSFARMAATWAKLAKETEPKGGK
jgi:hypothetical protein